MTSPKTKNAVSGSVARLFGVEPEYDGSASRFVWKLVIVFADRYELISSRNWPLIVKPGIV